MLNHIARGVLCIAAIVLGASAAMADERESAVNLSANVGIVSDYRFRGISYSGRDPALQGGLDLTTATGWYGGAWASTIEEAAGADVELDVYAGYGGTAGTFDYALGAYGYIYPGGRGLDYFELVASVGRQVGPAAMRLQVGYTPDQWNTDRDNLYIGAESEFALGDTPLGLRLRGGRENGGYDNKWDWEVGVTYQRDWLAMSVSYIGSNYDAIDEAGRLGKASLVGSIVATF